MLYIAFLDILYLLGQLPASTMFILVLSVSGITILALVNESACDRLIRILKVIFGRNDNKPPPRRR
jgi:hypothetical protein